MEKTDSKIINYTDSYVAFLDVLGFKELVLKDEREKLNRYFEIVRHTVSYLKNIQLKKTIGYIIISDSIILTMPKEQDKEQNINLLRQFCIAIGIIQGELALNNLWLRGAISSGNTYYDKFSNQIVGPAYINAYILEESMAVYPRVILDSKIIKELGFDSANKLIETINICNGGLNYSNWRKYVLFSWNNTNLHANTSISQDVPLFIDYLSQYSDSRLLDVIRNIELNMYQSVSVYSKYRWLTNYLKALIERDNLFEDPRYEDIVRRLWDL